VEEITAALEALEEEGSFCAQQTASAGALRIEVKGVGPLKFPLEQAGVKCLIDVAQPAQFGWRDKTLLDKKVRNAWEIPASRLKVEKDRWNAVLRPALDELAIDLGLASAGRRRAVLKAHLHNLLIYQPGQFFTAHQDTEKMPGMVATLVVVLPSPHEGGALIVDRQGERQRIQGAPAGNKLKLIAFYGDCHHEIKPVRKGYRVVLTYNLVLGGTKDAADAVSVAFPAARLTDALREYFAARHKNGRPKRWVYLLDHQYTPKSLDWKRLKNGDRLRAKALVKTAQVLKLDIHMALADIQEVWDAESEDGGWYSSRRRYSHWGDEDEETQESDEDSVMDGNYELRELIDDNIELKHWIDARGRSVRRRSEFVRSGELCWTTATSDLDPFKSEYQGYMGNYGNTLERWYHRAAIILSRRKNKASGKR
jgi:2-oxoglutarate-Fe(II)-dependent oxygenase superfamily protein